jgi:hypothetical protein
VRVRVKFYLGNQQNELKPTYMENNIKLIKQNVGIICESSDPDFLVARGEVNELEGFFCVLKHKKSDFKNVPSTVKVQVMSTTLN